MDKANTIMGMGTYMMESSGMARCMVEALMSGPQFGNATLETGVKGCGMETAHITSTQTPQEHQRNITKAVGRMA